MSTQDDSARDIPCGWVLATVGAIADYINGLAFKPSDWGRKGRPIIRIQNLTGQSDHLNLTTRDVDPIYIVQPGTILVSWSATLDVFVWRGPEAVLNQHIFKVVPVAAMSNHSFVRWALKNAIDEMWRGEHTHGTTMRHINRGPFLAHRLNLPPAKEQARIADAIESYVTRLDAAVTSLECVQVKLNSYRASVLKAAVEGRLVPTEASLARAEKRDYEPAEVLVNRILKERRRRWEQAELSKLKAGGKTPKDDKWKAKYKEALAPNTTLLAKLPEGWCWATVEAVSAKVVDGVHKKPEYVSSGVPFVTVKNLTAGPGIDLENLKHITVEDHEKFIARANPERGDLLVSKDGTLGVIRAVRTDRNFSIFVSVAMIKPVLIAMSDFLELALSSPPVQAQMVPKGSGLQHIHLEDLRMDCVPIPPVAEQVRILEAAQRHMSVVDWAEKAVAHHLAKLTRLRQAILKWAFEGKLADQDAADEPAEKLLARIQAECATEAPVKKNGRRKAQRAA